jgi:hypothetical protein
MRMGGHQAMALVHGWNTAMCMIDMMELLITSSGWPGFNICSDFCRVVGWWFQRTTPKSSTPT